MSGRLITDIRRARRLRKLNKRFSPAEVRSEVSGWATATYGTFLPKHRVGNPGGNTELFVRNGDGTYTLVEEASLR